MEISRLRLVAHAMTQLYHFHGGVHPPTHKALSVRSPIATPPLPSKLVIPFHQHVGSMAKPLVQAGDYVFKGQLIGMPEDGLSSAIHASTSGTIAEIGMQVVAHASGLPDLCATLIPDGKEAWVVREQRNPITLPIDEIRHILRLAGIVGLGGAVFPSDAKLRGGKHHVRTIVLNGAECEPYITCDDMLMRQRARDIVRGGDIIRRVLGADEVLIGIEDNKPQAIAMMQEACVDRSSMRVIAVPTLYPGGGAKQLIRVLTGIEVAAGVRSTDKGVQCFNVATAYSIYRAVAFSEPLLSRIVTVTGNVHKPQNFEVLIGTPVDELVAWAGGKPDTTHHIMGGPMMGVPLPNDQVSVVKACNCIIAASDALFPPAPPAMPCIRCTRCAEVCPQELQPQDLYWFAKSKNFGKAQEFHLFDCIECGACSYVCPSHIPLVQYYRFAKSEIWARDNDKKAADQARERHEFREYRIEREKQEKADKLAAKEKAALAAKPAASDDAQQKIQAALAVAKQQAVTPKNVSDLTPQQQAEIADIEARRANNQARAQSDAGT
ncbi:MAG: electron transport complex subunit RsxC [Gallionella sp.]|nr:electron transport complex subunit RsxC [Gallionella sp.]MDD4959666.1 electron transport complex subunit RsxC [Gallionella sp.]